MGLSSFNSGNKPRGIQNNKPDMRSYPPYLFQVILSKIIQMKAIHRVLVVLLSTFIIHSCHGDKRGLNLNDLLAAANANNNNNNPVTNNEQSNIAQQTLSSTSVKTQEFNDLQSLIAAMKGGNSPSGNTVNLDVGALLAKQAAQGNQNPHEQTIEISPNGEVSTPSASATPQSSDSGNKNNDNNNNNNALNLAKLAALLKQQGLQNNAENKEAATNQGGGPAPPNTLASLIANNKKQGDDDAGPPGLQVETEGDNSKNGHSRFTLQKGPDGSLSLVPIKEETGASRGLDIADLVKKPGNDVAAQSRQQLQLTTLVSQLIASFPYIST